jgi:hypothetical protein
MDNQQQPNYYDYYQNNSYSRLGFLSGLHLLDFVLLVLSFVLIVTPFGIGIYGQNNSNQIIQKEHDLGQVILALDQFYSNSSKTPSQRLYPIGACGDKPNEIDYEYTLQQHLTGKITSLDNHAYITEGNFPMDRFGVYSQKLDQRKAPLRDCSKVFSKNKNSENLVYKDGYQSCNFAKDASDSSFRSCYLYATDKTGQEYQLSYYDGNLDQFVIYKKYRDDRITKRYVNR